MQNEKLTEWKNHPVSKVFLELIKADMERTLAEVYSIPDDAPRDRIIRLLERVKVDSEILDIEHFLLDELGEA